MLRQRSLHVLRQRSLHVLRQRSLQRKRTHAGIVPLAALARLARHPFGIKRFLITNGAALALSYRRRPAWGLARPDAWPMVIASSQRPTGRTGGRPVQWLDPCANRYSLFENPDIST